MMRNIYANHSLLTVISTGEKMEQEAEMEARGEGSSGDTDMAP